MRAGREGGIAEPRRGHGIADQRLDEDAADPSEALAKEQAQILRLVARGAPLRRDARGDVSGRRAARPRARCSIDCSSRTDTTARVCRQGSTRGSSAQARSRRPASTGEAVVVPDVTVDPRWTRYRSRCNPASAPAGRRRSWRRAVTVGHRDLRALLPRGPRANRRPRRHRDDHLAAIAIERKRSRTASPTRRSTTR